MFVGNILGINSILYFIPLQIINPDVQDCVQPAPRPQLVLQQPGNQQPCDWLSGWRMEQITAWFCSTTGQWKTAPATLTGERTAPAVREGETTPGWSYIQTDAAGERAKVTAVCWCPVEETSGTEPGVWS